MASGLKTLYTSCIAFFVFWIALLFATFFNSLLPLEVLRENVMLRHLITDGMRDTHNVLIKAAVAGGTFKFRNVIVATVHHANIGFVNYFKEISVMVALFQITPILRG
jgi:hypothetical protein